MPIVYSAVTSHRNIVSNFASCDGNFTEIAEQVVSKLPQCSSKMTYSHGLYLLHYICQDDHLYFCITDKLCQRSRAFLFLNEIQRRFITRKKSDDFTTTLAAEMYRYSEDYSTIVIRKGELDELNSIGVGCSESLLGEKILYINNPDIVSYSTISHVRATPGLISVSGVAPTGTSSEEALVTTSEEISVIRPTPETVASERTTDITTSKNITVLCPTQERISSVDTIFNRTPIISPRLYVVIVGMVILVIAMSVYALGPVSCVVVTGIGMYSLLRAYLGSKDKSE